MKRTAWLGLAVCLALPAFGQHPRPGVRIGGPSYGFGFGNVVFPAGVPSNPHGAFTSITQPGFASRLSGIVSGFRPYTGAPSGRPARHFGRSVLVPVAYPVFVGGYYDAYPTQQAPSVIVIPPSQQPAPQVVINQTFATPPEATAYAPGSSDDSGVRMYQAPTAPAVENPGVASSQEPTVYLIAFKDGSVHTAIAYWVEDDTLYYVTRHGKPNKASMELIDREFSLKLNHQRGLDFQLPAPK